MKKTTFTVLICIILVFFIVKRTGIMRNSRHTPPAKEKQPIEKQQPAEKRSNEDKLIAELNNPPQNNIQRADKLAQLFTQAGITNVIKQKARLERTPRGQFIYENIIATVQGQSSNTIVVSAHTDCSPEGKGVIDDWSGACMLVNLANTLKDKKPIHTLIFLGTTLEEQGMQGAKFYVKSLSRTRLAEIHAMIELECLGVSKTKVWQTGSADELEALADDVARQNNIPIKLRELVGVAADSSAFNEKDVPTITFDSLEESDFPLIDSPRDSFESINRQNYAEQYKFLVQFIAAVDSHSAKFSPANKEKTSVTKHAEAKFAPDAEELKKSGAVVVGEVLTGGPEDKAGLMKGDKIIQFGDSKISSIDDLMGRVRVLKVGEQVTVQIQRGTQTGNIFIQY